MFSKHRWSANALVTLDPCCSKQIPRNLAIGKPQLFRDAAKRFDSTAFAHNAISPWGFWGQSPIPSNWDIDEVASPGNRQMTAEQPKLPVESRYPVVFRVFECGTLHLSPHRRVRPKPLSKTLRHAPKYTQIQSFLKSFNCRFDGIGAQPS